MYFETSVVSAYDDNQIPDRQHQTEEFWGRLDACEAATSELAREEVAQTPDPTRRAQLLAWLTGFTIYALTDDSTQLARQSIEATVFTPTMFIDAWHVTAAVLTQQDTLRSWNVKPLVNRRQQARISDVTMS
jgi:hypothetical protein